MLPAPPSPSGLGAQRTAAGGGLPQPSFPGVAVGPIEGMVTPAGWYPDPWQWWSYRWWDGQRWSSYTHEPPIVEVAAPPEPLPTFPVRAGVIGLAILAASLVAEKFLMPIVLSWLPVGLYVAIAVALTYGPSFAWSLRASKRYGSGRVLDDLGVAIRGVDVWWGLLTWLCVLVGNIVLLIVIRLAHIPFTSNVGGGRGLAGRDRSLFLMFAIVAVVAAPFFEELLFRGLVMRSLRSRLPFPAALILQGIGFGCAHFDPSFGAGNIGLLLVLSWAGVALGFSAHRLRRNGVSMVGHAIMNGIVMIALLAGAGSLLA